MLALLAVFLIAVLALYLVQLLPIDGRLTLALQIVIIVVAIIYIMDAA